MADLGCCSVKVTVIYRAYMVLCAYLTHHLKRHLDSAVFAQYAFVTNGQTDST